MFRHVIETRRAQPRRRLPQQRRFAAQFTGIVQGRVDIVAVQFQQALAGAVVVAGTAVVVLGVGVRLAQVLINRPRQRRQQPVAIAGHQQRPLDGRQMGAVAGQFVHQSEVRQQFAGVLGQGRGPVQRLAGQGQLHHQGRYLRAQLRQPLLHRGGALGMHQVMEHAEPQHQVKGVGLQGLQ